MHMYILHVDGNMLSISLRMSLSLYQIPQQFVH
jgi:hypothetical protein